jgi:hypothetical protein
MNYIIYCHTRMSVDKEIFDTHVIYGMYCTD